MIYQKARRCGQRTSRPCCPTVDTFIQSRIRSVFITSKIVRKANAGTGPLSLTDRFRGFSSPSDQGYNVAQVKTLSLGVNMFMKHTIFESV